MDEIRGAAKKGFTLIELIVVLAILAFLSTMAVSSYLGGRESAALRSDVREAAAILQLARMRAISTGIPHGVVFKRGTGGTADEYMIFMDCNLDGKYTDDDDSIRNNTVITSRNQCAGLTHDPRIQEQPIHALTRRNYFTRIMTSTAASGNDLEYILFNQMGQAVQLNNLVSGTLCIQNHAERNNMVEQSGVRVIGGTGMIDTFPTHFVVPNAWTSTDNCQG